MQMEATTVSWSLCEAQLSAPPISFSKTHHFFLSFFFSISSQSPHSATLSSHGNGRNNNHLCSFPFFLLIFFFFSITSLWTQPHTPSICTLHQFFSLPKSVMEIFLSWKKKCSLTGFISPLSKTSLSYSYTSCWLHQFENDTKTINSAPRDCHVPLNFLLCPAATPNICTLNIPPRCSSTCFLPIFPLVDLPTNFKIK